MDGNQGSLGEIPVGFALRYTLNGYDDVMLRITWSPDGRLLASSVDRTVRIWEPSRGQHLHTLLGHAHGVNQAAWSPDGQLISSSSCDTTLKV